MACRLLAAALLAIGGIGATADDSVAEQTSTIISKTVVSSTMRLTFLVGLEGTGHHYVSAATAHMFAENDEVDHKATDCIKIVPYYTAFSMTRTPAYYNETYDLARFDMQKLALQEASLPLPGTIATVCNGQSYPAGNGKGKVMNYVDIRLLAEVAEERGVDLRVVYLRRSAKDIFIANTVHRHFQDTLGDADGTKTNEERYMDYTRVLFTDIAVVDSLLGEIDPAFVVCHDYNSAGDPEQASKIAEFVAPNREIAEMLRASLVATDSSAHVPGKERFPIIEDSARVIERLQKKLDAFEPTYCGRGT